MANFIIPQNIMDSVAKGLREIAMRKGVYTNFTVFQRDAAHQNDFPTIQAASDPIQMQPVMFKELRLHSFNSWTEQSDDNEHIYRSTISLNWSYQHFDGGSNGCSFTGVVITFYYDPEGPEWKNHIISMKFLERVSANALED